MARGNTLLARRLLWVAAYVNVILLFIMICSASGDGTGVVWSVLLAALVDGAIGYYALKQGLLFELLKERTWKAVCSGLGFSEVVGSWGVGVGLPRRTQKMIYPRLRDVHGTDEAWIGIVIPFAGQTVAEYTKHADAFALAFQVPFVSFELARNGCITVRAGNVPVPAAYDHPGRLEMPAHTTTTQLLPDAPSLYMSVQPVPNLAEQRALLQRVPMARDLQGQT